MDQEECRAALGALAGALGLDANRSPGHLGIAAMLARFPPPEERCFEHCVFTLINHYAKPQVGKLTELAQALDSILATEPPGVEDAVRFAALYGRCMVARHSHDVPKYKQLLKDHEGWAGKRETRVSRWVGERIPWAREWLWDGHPRASFLHLKAMMHALRQGPDAKRLAMSCARQALDDLPDHAGVQHHYAELVAAAIEGGEIPSGEEGERLRDALSLVRQAVGDETKNFGAPYPKFYATLGRLEALRSDFDAARDSLQKAIKLETVSYDSAARRTDYKLMLADVAHRLRLQKQERDFEERMRCTAEDTKYATRRCSASSRACSR